MATVASDTTRQTSTSKQPESEIACKICGGKKSGRNLVVAFDGTSNKFGDFNTNVVELYNRIIKDDDDTQMAYYNSGIGTYARPTWRSLAYLRRVILNKLDLAIAWNFENIILKGYRWLSDHYKPGDKIFLFGFSRGAYQVRVLAGMIAKVGLILPGNEEQIPFAYEIYADLRPHKVTPSKSGEKPSKIKEKVSDSMEGAVKSMEGAFRGGGKPSESGDKDTKSGEKVKLSDRFKKTFSRKDVNVHFVGVWDTVSSVGIIRGKNLPLTNANGHICYVRHALALDERRVKFLPEYIWPGASSDISTSLRLNQPSKQEEHREHVRDKYTQEERGTGHTGDFQHGEMLKRTKFGDSERESSINDSRALRVKEVWFLGTHSDIGGGTVTNKELNNAAIPVLWMGNEALMAGLKLKPSRVEWDWKQLKKNTPTESMTTFYSFMEFLPFKRLTYADPDKTCWQPHMFRGRIIKPGQKIHASVAYTTTENYTPRAEYDKGIEGHLRNIQGKGDTLNKHNCAWMDTIGDILEKDLFDHSAAGDILKRFEAGEVRTDLSRRLNFIASSREGSQAIMAAPDNLEIVLKMLEEARTRADGCDILASLAKNGLAPPDISENDDVFSAVSTLIDGVDVDGSISASRLLRHFASHFASSMRVDRSIIMCLSRMMMNQEKKARTNACQTLFHLSDRGSLWSVKPIEAEIARFLDTQDATEKIAGAWIIAKFSTTVEKSLRSDPNIFSKLVHMLQDKSPAISSSGAYALSVCVQYGGELTALTTKAVAERIHNMLASDDGSGDGSGDAQLRWACAELLKTLVTQGELEKILSQRDIFSCLVHVLRSEDEDEIKTASGLFERLSTDEKCQPLMTEKHVVTKIIGLLNIDRKGVSPIGATTVLENFTQHRVFRDAMIGAGIIEKLTKMLDTISINEQDRALRVLKCLAVHKDFRNGAVNREIFHKVVKKLNKKAHPYITATALDILEELSYDKIFQKHFTDEGVVRKVVKVFKKGRSSVKIHAASFLQAISQNARLRQDFVPADVIPTLIEMLTNGHEKERVAAIDLLTAFPEESSSALLRSEYAFQAIIRMFDIGKVVEKMGAAKLLKIFGQYPEFRDVAVGRMDVIRISVAKLSIDIAANRRSALKVLSAYLEYKETRAQISEQKVIPELINILKENTCATRFKVTEFLGELVVHPEFRSRMPSPEDMIPILMSQLDAAVRESDDRALVCEALKAFADYHNYRKMIPPQVLESLEIEANGKVIPAA